MSRLLAVSLALILATPVGTADKVLAPSTEQQRLRSIKRGVNWLLKHQNPDKGWGCGEPRTPSSAGITGLVVVSLMGAGSTPTRGRHAKKIREGVDFLLRRANPNSGALVGPYITEMGAVYDHACAVLGLAMAHGSYPTRVSQIKRVLRRGVLYLIQTQLASGGWPRGGGDDPAVTAFAWLALRAAYSSGLKVDIDPARLETFLANNAQVSTRRLSGSSRINHVAGWLRVAVGVGRVTPQVQQMLDHVAKTFLSSDVPSRVSEWDFIAVGLLAQAYLQRSNINKNWKRWFPPAAKYFLSIQDKRDGSWNIVNCLSCKALATALALIFLETPDRMLPFYDL